MDENKILFVDLDGTLIKEDLSNLAFFYNLRKKPFKTIIYIIVFLFRGKPYLKKKISKNFKVPIEDLTYNKAALNFIREVKNRHRVVYLISGSHQLLVDQIHDHLKIFFESFGTKGDYNMVGFNNVSFINEKLKIYDFLYFGNSTKDIPIWKHCNKIIYTNAKKKLKKMILKSKLEKKEIKAKFDLS